nr:hypothetical protein [Tanacetum cinerariifolium]
ISGCLCGDFRTATRRKQESVCEVSLALWDVRVWLGLLYELNMHYMHLTRTSVLVFASSCETPQGGTTVIDMVSFLLGYISIDNAYIGFILKFAQILTFIVWLAKCSKDMKTWVIHQLKPIKHPLLINHPLLNSRRNNSLGGNRGRRWRFLMMSQRMRTMSLHLSVIHYLVVRIALYLMDWWFSVPAYKNRKLRSGGLRRLKKIGSDRRVKSPMEKDGLGVQEDASKRGRMIDQNAEIALDDETRGRTNDDEMFGVDDLA